LARAKLGLFLKSAWNGRVVCPSSPVAKFPAVHTASVRHVLPTPLFPTTLISLPIFEDSQDFIALAFHESSLSALHTFACLDALQSANLT
jgi:hypothetical protein